MFYLENSFYFIKGGYELKLLTDIEKEMISRVILIQLLVLGLAIYVINHWVMGLILVLSHLFIMYMLLIYPRLQRIVTVKVDAQSFDNSLQIAHETLPFLRQGLNSETAHHAAEVIKKIGDVPAVAVTDKQYVLAF
jgi:two-component system LytT family sensor kinase